MINLVSGLEKRNSKNKNIDAREAETERQEYIGPLDEPAEQRKPGVRE
jgi:hypothetical protein